MGRVGECGQHIKAGKTPEQISAVLGVSIGTVIGYVDRAIGERMISRSEVLLNIRDKLHQELSEDEQKRSVSVADMEAMLSIPPLDVGQVRGDLHYLLKHGYRLTLATEIFQKLASLEQSLHSLVAMLLVFYFGQKDDSWWISGVPKHIRDACVRWQKADESPAHPFTYTSIAHLSTIIEASWSVLGPHLPPDAIVDPPTFSRALRHLKEIRNRVAHPVRPFIPSREDYTFVTTWESRLARRNWRLLPTDQPAMPA